MDSPHLVEWNSCALNHNFAVWQRYALNGLHFPIDHVLNTNHRYPQNLDFIFNNRKVAISECDVASHRVALAAKLCFQPRNRCVHTLAQNSPVPVRRSGNIMLSARQGYALKHKFSSNAHSSELQVSELDGRFGHQSRIVAMHICGRRSIFRD